MPEMDDDALLEALGMEIAPSSATEHSSQEERLISGFEDILRFVDANRRAPQHGEGRDIFERLYAIRLDRLRVLPQAKALLAGMDRHGLLDGPPIVGADSARDSIDDELLLAELGEANETDNDNITVLRHVSSFEERRAAEDVANRTKCQDFEKFKPLFERVEVELRSGVRKSFRFGRDASVARGNFFILGGQMVYVAEMGEAFRTPNGESDARLRVIYSNGTESDLLIRSLQRALYKDETGRRLSDPAAGPLFGDTLEVDDIVSGTIYVLRSNSTHPFVAEHRELVHKIGVTGGDVDARIAGASKDPTYLLADVEVVATYRLSNINRVKLENLFHRVFSRAQLDLQIVDRFGNQVKPREWFLVPLHVIDQVVERLQRGTASGVTYDPTSASLIADPKD